MRFEWDDEKERINIEKHKIDFETAARVFEDDNWLERQQNKKRRFIMVIRKDVDLKKELTTEQLEMLELLKENPVSPDEECPELTKEQLNQFARVAEERQKERKNRQLQSDCLHRHWKKQSHWEIKAWGPLSPPRQMGNPSHTVKVLFAVI